MQIRGSGPWGLPTPADLQAMFDTWQEYLSGVTPRLQSLLAQPGADEMRAELQAGTRCSVLA